MSDDRGDYLDEVLHQTAVLAHETDSIERVKDHLGRHGYDGTVE